MELPLVVGVAVRAIRRNQLRSSLTILGVVIGIAALTTTVSVGQSAAWLVKSQLGRLGSNVLLVAAEQRLRPRQADMLTAADSQAINRECPSVLAATPLLSVTRQVSFGRFHRRPAAMGGVGTGYLRVRSWPLAAGNFFTERDVQTSAKVCVLGQTITTKLFQTADPLGKTVRIGSIPFRVIGILQPKGANLLGQDQDDIVVMPYTTVRKRLQGSGFDRVDSILLSARSDQQTEPARRQIERLLRERHRVRDDDPVRFRVTDMKEYATVLETSMHVLTLTLATIAGISLLVGGIGIMNIMLVSVTERTREIGIRMAVGADAQDILRQFLVEALLLSSMGGVVGILLGIATSWYAIHLMNVLMPNARMPATVSLSAALIAMLFAAGVGVFFGYYPARRASQLDPIEALRYE